MDAGSEELIRVYHLIQIITQVLQELPASKRCNHLQFWMSGGTRTVPDDKRLNQ